MAIDTFYAGITFQQPDRVNEDGQGLLDLETYKDEVVLRQPTDTTSIFDDRSSKASEEHEAHLR